MKHKVLLISLSIFLVFITGSLVQAPAQKKLPDVATIQGVLLKSNGKPLPYTEIELVPLSSYKLINDRRFIAASSMSGKFSFFNVPVGQYTLSINFDDKPTDLSPYPTFFYPKTSKRSEAEFIEIKETTRIKNITFQLPPALMQREISGSVISETGTLIEDAYVSIIDLEFDRLKSFSKVKTDINGKFKVKGFIGRAYQIAAILFDENRKTAQGEPVPILAAGESKAFTLDSATPNIKLILKESDDFKKLREKYIGKLFLER